MKRFAAALVVAGLALVAFATFGYADQPQDLHCPDGGTKTESQVDGDLDDVVLDAGTQVCVKAEPGNTGVVTANGEDSLCDILKDAGIVGGDGECRNVSYYVVYENTPEPSPSPTVTPTDEPTPTPTPTTTPPEEFGEGGGDCPANDCAPPKKLARTGPTDILLTLGGIGLFLTGSGLLLRGRGRKQIA